MFHVGKDYKKKGERYYKIAPITIHIIVIATENSTAPINSSTSLVLSDIVNRFKLLFTNLIFPLHSVVILSCA